MKETKIIRNSKWLIRSTGSRCLGWEIWELGKPQYKMACTYKRDALKHLKELRKEENNLEPAVQFPRRELGEVIE